MYTIYWVSGKTLVPVRDFSLNPQPVITRPDEEEELTLEEAKERLKYLSGKNPSQQFIMKEQ